VVPLRSPLLGGEVEPSYPRRVRSAVAPALLCVLALAGCQKNGPAAQQQSACAAEAQQDFTASGAEANPVNAYTVHYNARLKTCFIVEKFAGKTANSTSTGLTLMEASLRTVYATYTDIIYARSNGTAVVEECDLNVAGAAPKNCRSRDEWVKLIAPYFENASLPK
jgi:hypothetical protein